MGYLKRKLDRARSRELVRAMNDRAIDGAMWEPIPESAPRARAFVRFSIGENHPVSLRRMGIFSACYHLLRRSDLEEGLEEGLRSSIRWFEDNLVVPDVREEQAIFLFKSEAASCMQQIWHLVAWLRHADLHVEMQTVAKPGRIVYEDEHQVAAIPWADSGPL